MSPTGTATAYRASPSIQIYLGEQRAYFYKGDPLKGVSLLSTGREDHRRQ